MTFEQVSLVLDEFITPHDATKEYSLERMYSLLNTLGDPQESLKIIHVAGTSGKTSTAYYIASLLQAAGYKTGLTVSPHIDEINERAQIGLTPLPEAEFCNEFNLFMDILDSSNIKPIYFEVVIAFSLWLFHKRNVDYVVVEVGIGGLLDSTNIVSRSDKICVITDIGLDHTKILGNTIEKIAFQKAGIIQSKNAVFMNQQSPEIMDIFKKRCTSVAAILNVVEKEPIMTDLPLFQRRNFGLADDVVNFVLARNSQPELSAEKTQTAANIVVPARMEEVKYQEKSVVLDGSHNEQKIEALVRSMKQRYPNKKIHLLVSFGYVEEKQASVLASLKLLLELGQNIVVTDYIYNPKSSKGDEKAKLLGDIAKQAGFQSITVEPDPTIAFNLFMDDPGEIGLVTGSFFLLNPVRDIVFNK